MTDPSDLAHAIAKKLTEAHQGCHPTACPLGGIWAEDVQEVLDLAQSEVAS